jgi:hypothetical protein
VENSPNRTGPHVIDRSRRRRVRETFLADERTPRSSESERGRQHFSMAGVMLTWCLGSSQHNKEIWTKHCYGLAVWEFGLSIKKRKKKKNMWLGGNVEYDIWEGAGRAATTRELLLIFLIFSNSCFSFHFPFSYFKFNLQSNFRFKPCDKFFLSLKCTV